MHCTNRNHHIENGEPCDNQQGHHCQCNGGGNPHDMHWHINKISFKGWALNFVYFALHAVEIYLITKVI